MELSSYPKIFNLGHAWIKDLLLDEVMVQEKIDGSQFSFGVKDGQLLCRSKGTTLDIAHPQKMFEKAVQMAQTLTSLLHDGYIYRGEYLEKPKHNTLIYGRVPQQHVILFDIQPAPGDFFGQEFMISEAARLGLELVPTLYAGKLDSPTLLTELLQRESVLGGCLIEGVVVKNYHRLGPDGHQLMGKHVSEAFKETHRADWKERNPGRGDVVQALIQDLGNPARWSKAVQHLDEAGTLQRAPQDIGPLIKEVQRDVLAECETHIKDALYRWAKDQIMRGVTVGLPQWYKEQLLEQQFEPAGHPEQVEL